jgi:hypothetical protein
MARQSAYYYILHINNLKEVLEKGIYSHNKVLELGIKPEMISNSEVMELRKGRKIEGEKTLWDYANVYFQARNPMLWTIIKKYGVENIVVLGLRPTIHNLEGVRIANGNAARLSETGIFPKSQLKEVFNSIRKELNFEYWKEGDDSKRKIMAECLVPDNIPSEYINSIFVANNVVRDKIIGMLGSKHMRYGIITHPNSFFQGEIKRTIDNVSVIQGDMFFSQMQTLTISVNTIGVMGKGLASRAKYQFRDVFDYYKDSCTKGELKMGLPVLYKRTKSVNELLSSDYLDDEDEPTWFLLFPTKTHFMYNSDPAGIERGLIWVKENYEGLGIKSLALPALGCGLGNLSWSQIGPMMVKHLRGLKIKVSIYLPAEKNIPDEWLTEEFLSK